MKLHDFKTSSMIFFELILLVKSFEINIFVDDENIIDSYLIDKKNLIVESPNT